MFDGCVKMDFSETLKALKAGQKVKLPEFEEGTYLELKNDNYYIKYNSGSIRNYFSAIPIWYTLAEDWEIVEDIPEVKLERNFTFFCPNCQTHRVLQQLKIPDFEKEVVTCGNCGTKVKFTNSDYGVLDSEFNKNASKNTISKFELPLRKRRGFLVHSPLL